MFMFAIKINWRDSKTILNNIIVVFSALYISLTKSYIFSHVCYTYLYCRCLARKFSTIWKKNTFGRVMPSKARYACFCCIQNKTFSFNLHHKKFCIFTFVHTKWIHVNNCYMCFHLCMQLLLYFLISDIKFKYLHYFFKICFLQKISQANSNAC